MISSFCGYSEFMCLDARRECYINFGKKISAVISMQKSIQYYSNWNSSLERIEDHSYFFWV